ncbi:MAG: hypothetical protein JSS43_07895 [Proteobacteria bacterium]|nr:hypothetical protein [Pseudomonadota bacterium]
MDMLTSVLPFAAVLGALAIGVIAVHGHHGARQELRFVRVRSERGRRR